MAGAWDGFGDPAVLSRITWVSIGFVSLGAGFYLAYLAADRDMWGAIGTVIDGIVFNLWR